MTADDDVMLLRLNVALDRRRTFSVTSGTSFLATNVTSVDVDERHYGGAEDDEDAAENVAAVGPEVGVEISF